MPSYGAAGGERAEASTGLAAITDRTIAVSTGLNEYSIDVSRTMRADLSGGDCTAYELDVLPS